MFLGLLTTKISENSTPEELERVYNLFDLDSEGNMTLEGLKKVSAEVGDNLSEEELKDVLARCDLDKNGKLSLEDFSTVVTSKLR